jgi:NADH:ubiquinone oxidoreductase subunit K
MDSVEKKPDKDVIYTLRCAHQKQAQLILLADQKAQILSGLVLVVLTLLGTRLIYMNTDGFFDAMNPFTIAFLLLFFAAEVVAISLGILVVMPRIPSKQKEVGNIENIQNPLFFGAFANFEQEEYLDHVADNIVCNDSARRYLAKDIYQGGMVLSEQYKKLCYAYRYALIGFIFLVLTFVSVFVF